MDARVKPAQRTQFVRAPDAAQRAAPPHKRVYARLRRAMVVRCRAGAVTNTALGTVPVLRSSAEEALHRARDTALSVIAGLDPANPSASQNFFKYGWMRGSSPRSVPNLCVPRTQRSAPPLPISASTRVFDALWWCAAEPGP